MHSDDTTSRRFRRLSRQPVPQMVVPAPEPRKIPRGAKLQPDPCPICNGPVYATAQQVQLGRGKTCSYRCRGLLGQTVQEVTCSICGDPMPRRSGVRAVRLGILPTCRVCSNKNRATPAIDRFKRYVGQPESTISCPVVGTPCRLYNGPVGGDGYGSITLQDDKQVGAHRFAYAIAAGVLIETLNGVHIAHTCDMPICVENDGEGTYTVRGIAYRRFGHLYAADNTANTYDKIDKGRARYPGPKR